MTCGRIDHPRDAASPFDPAARPANSARVTIRRAAAGDGEVGLFFGGVFGRRSLGLSAAATASLEGNVRGFSFESPSRPATRCLLLPFTFDEAAWDAAVAGAALDAWRYDPKTRAYGPGGDGVPEINLYGGSKVAAGNFGTIDIGDPNNAVGDIRRQILDGPTAADLARHGGAFALGPDGTLVAEGDTGLSAGIAAALQRVRGEPRVIALHRSFAGTGNGVRYTLVRFVGCVIVEVRLAGGDKRVLVQPEHVIDPTAVGGGPVSSKSFVWKPLQLSR